MCVHVYACAHVCGSKSMPMNVKARAKVIYLSLSFSSSLQIFFSRSVLHLISITNGLDCQTRELWESSIPTPPPSDRVTDQNTMPTFYLNSGHQNSSPQA